jgi:hypothetical protein
MRPVVPFAFLGLASSVEHRLNFAKCSQHPLELAHFGHPDKIMHPRPRRSDVTGPLTCDLRTLRENRLRTSAGTQGPVDSETHISGRQPLIAVIGARPYNSDARHRAG